MSSKVTMTFALMVSKGGKGREEEGRKGRRIMGGRGEVRRG